MIDTITLNGTSYRMSDIKSMEIVLDEDAKPPVHMLLVAFNNKTWDTFPLTFELLLQLTFWLQERNARHTRLLLSEKLKPTLPADQQPSMS